MSFNFFKPTPYAKSAAPSRYPFSSTISSVSPLPPDPFTGKPVKPVELADIDPFTNRPVAPVELREPVFPKTPAVVSAPAAPAAPAAAAPVRTLQQKQLINPEREAERQRKEALKKAKGETAKDEKGRGAGQGLVTGGLDSGGFGTGRRVGRRGY